MIARCDSLRFPIYNFFIRCLVQLAYLLLRSTSPDLPYYSYRMLCFCYLTSYNTWTYYLENLIRLHIYFIHKLTKHEAQYFKCITQMILTYFRKSYIKHMAKSVFPLCILTSTLTVKLIISVMDTYFRRKRPYNQSVTENPVVKPVCLKQEVHDLFLKNINGFDTNSIKVTTAWGLATKQVAVASIERCVCWRTALCRWYLLPRGRFFSVTIIKSYRLADINSSK